MTAAEWEAFVGGVPWFLREGAQVEVGATRRSVAAGVDPERFPALHRLVRMAMATPATIDGEGFDLLSWRLAGSGEPVSWLCPAVGGEPPAAEVHPDHASLLRGFGGIAERSANEPETWLMNCDAALTAEIATHDASMLEDYRWLLGDDPEAEWPIDVPGYYAICEEANGNTTLCHRTNGDVVLFAPDHDFDHIEVLEGCPPYSLYRINGAPRFVEWVEAVAGQWLAVVVATA